MKKVVRVAWASITRLIRYARDRFHRRVPPPEIPSRIPRRVR